MKMRWTRKTFVTWEGLRVVFMAILAYISIRGLRPVWSRMPAQEWMHIAAGAVFLNLLFFLGPVIESLVPLDGWKKHALRCVLFISGTWLCTVAVGLYIGGLHEVLIGRD